MKSQSFFTNGFFYLKVLSFRLMLEYNYIYMQATAELDIADSVDPIFQYIFQSMRHYLTPNDCKNIGLQMLNRWWSIYIAFHASPQKNNPAELNRSFTVAKSHKQNGRLRNFGTVHEEKRLFRSLCDTSHHLAGTTCHPSLIHRFLGRDSQHGQLANTLAVMSGPSWFSKKMSQ